MSFQEQKWISSANLQLQNSEQIIIPLLSHPAIPAVNIFEYNIINQRIHTFLTNHPQHQLTPIPFVGVGSLHLMNFGWLLRIHYVYMRLEGWWGMARKTFLIELIYNAVEITYLKSNYCRREEDMYSCVMWKSQKSQEAQWQGAGLGEGMDWVSTLKGILRRRRSLNVARRQCRRRWGG